MLNRKESLDLRRLVKTWRDSGPNLQKMLDADRTLNRRVENVFRVSLLATKSGRAHLALVPGVRIVPPAAEEIAVLMFVELVLNPWWDRLGGPCEQCGTYYVKKTVRQNAYCSRDCGTRATAMKATLRRREEEHREKLRRAAAAAQTWASSRTPIDWKQWVSLKEPDITPKWLTRAVNKGELQPPVKKDGATRRASD
jgi:hypothetical protein